MVCDCCSISLIWGQIQETWFRNHRMYLLNTRAQIGLIIQIESVMCDPVVVRIWNQTSGEKACRGEGGVKNLQTLLLELLLFHSTYWAGVLLPHSKEHQSLAGHPAFIRFPKEFAGIHYNNTPGWKDALWEWSLSRTQTLLIPKANSFLPKKWLT